jgi:uncharacterized membrane protein YphA (DoxX/SURF4 family)
MNIVLWILQIVLAFVFAGAGATKLVQTRDQLANRLGNWVNDFPAALLKWLGLAEELAAIGLIVPPLVHIAPILTPLAAIGVVIVMIGAILIHARRLEFPNVALTVALAIMAAVVAWARFGTYAF